MTGPARTAPVGVYPGTFDPPTVAHLHLAERAVEALGLRRLDLAVSTATLGKDDAALSPVADRLAELRRLVAGRPDLAARTTTASLLADIAAGYDVLVMGADKWHQVLDPSWYGGAAERDRALRRLPQVVVAPRPPWPLPGEHPDADPPGGVSVLVLDTDPRHHEVSATAVRAGRAEWRARPRL
jgi:nicotinic acid mononucleotide adenylyltransferase